MAARQQRGQDLPDLLALAEDDRLDVRKQATRELVGMREILLARLHLRLRHRLRCRRWNRRRVATLPLQPTRYRCAPRKGGSRVSRACEVVLVVVAVAVETPVGT